jgi:AraC-like DNA-binding protein
MELKLSDYASGRVIYQNRYPDNFEGESDVDESEYNIDCNDYSIHLNEKWFEGIHISVTSISAIKAERFILQLQHDHTGFLYCLEGNLSFTENGNSILLCKNKQCISINLPKRLIFDVAEKTKYIYVQLTQSYYRKLTNGLFNHDLLAFNLCTVSPEINLILQSLIKGRHFGRVRRLFLESKIYELIICYTRKNNQPKAVSLKQDDINKILLAKKLVESDLQTPSSLLELSRKAGINDYKLKKGFKEITGHTVFGYLCKLRMEKAYDILANEKKTVNETAFLVGYKNPQHFIVAFKKQYNILPGSLNKN